MTEQIGSGPLDPKYAEGLRQIAMALDQSFNEGKTGEDREVGFVLMVFPLKGQIGRCNYISNSNRADIKTLLREQLAYFEGQSDKLEGHA